MKKNYSFKKERFKIVLLIFLFCSSIISAQVPITWNSSSATNSIKGTAIVGGQTVNVTATVSMNLNPKYGGSNYYGSSAYNSNYILWSGNNASSTISTVNFTAIKSALGVTNDLNWFVLDNDYIGFPKILTITFDKDVVINKLAITDLQQKITGSGSWWSENFTISGYSFNSYTATNFAQIPTTGFTTSINGAYFGSTTMDPFSAPGDKGTMTFSGSTTLTAGTPLKVTFDGTTQKTTSIGTFVSNDVNPFSIFVSAPCTPDTVTGNLNITTGSTSQLTASSNGGTWESSNTTVATISSTGLVTALNAGTTTITYTNAVGCVTTNTITVTNPAASCTSIPTPQLSTINMNTSGNINGVNVTRSTTGNVRFNNTVYNGGGQNLCQPSYSSGYAWLFSESTNAPASVTYTFSCPQTSVEVFLLLMGNSSQYVTNPVDIAEFKVNGSTTGFTLTEVGNYDCTNSVNVSGNQVIADAKTNTSATDTSIRITSSTPFTSITVTNPRYGFGTGEDTSTTLGDTSGYGYFVELCPSTINTDPVNINTQPLSKVLCQKEISSLTVGASTPLNSSLTYQWYSNTTSSTTGATLISGATSPTYNLPTNSTGTKYYFVRIYNGTCSSTTSSIVSVVVNNCACYKNPTLSIDNGLPTQVGITSLQRAGADQQDNWPFSREGGYLALEANTKGFVLNRLTSAQINKIITDGKAVEGMAVYDVTLNCLKIYDGSEFKCFNVPSCDQ